MRSCALPSCPSGSPNCSACRSLHREASLRAGPPTTTPPWRAHSHLATIAFVLPHDTLRCRGVSRPDQESGTPIFGPAGAFHAILGSPRLDRAAPEENKACKARSCVVLEHIDQAWSISMRPVRRRYNHPSPLAAARGRRRSLGLPHGHQRRSLNAVRSPRDRSGGHRLTGVVKAGQRLEGERARRDGRIFAYAFNPLPEGGGVLTFSDVTEARKREARLARSEEGFRYRFRNLPLPVWTYSSRTLKFLDVNDAAIAEYGYTREISCDVRHRHFGRRAREVSKCSPKGAFVGLRAD